MHLESSAVVYFRGLTNLRTSPSRATSSEKKRASVQRKLPETERRRHSGRMDRTHIIHKEIWNSKNVASPSFDDTVLSRRGTGDLLRQKSRRGFGVSLWSLSGVCSCDCCRLGGCGRSCSAGSLECLCGGVCSVPCGLACFGSVVSQEEVLNQ